MDLTGEELTCTLLAYGETTGGPVGICSLEAAQQWQGSEQADTLYWDVTDAMGITTLFRYNQDYSFFNTETGNFALFTAADCLVLAEIISIEADAVLPWKGLPFRLKLGTFSAFELTGWICFFNSSMSIKGQLLPQQSLYALEQRTVWNMAVLACDYHEVGEVTFQSATMHVEGICFRRK